MTTVPYRLTLGLISALILLFTLAGCQVLPGGAPQPQEPTAAPTATLAPTLPPSPTAAPSLVLSTRVIEEVSESPKYEIKLQYPMLEWGGDPRVEAFNQAAKTLAEEEAKAFKEGTQSTLNDPNTQGMASSLIMSYTPTYGEDGIISVIFNAGYYMAGAAHPGSYAYTLTYDLNQGSQLALGDLFQSGAAYLETLSAYCLDELRKRDVLAWEDGALPLEENYSRWNITPDGLMITFDEYMVSSHAAGPQTVIVPYDSLRDILRTDGPLAAVLAKYSPGE